MGLSFWRRFEAARQCVSQGASNAHMCTEGGVRFRRTECDRSPEAGRPCFLMCNDLRSCRTNESIHLTGVTTTKRNRQGSCRFR